MIRISEYGAITRFDLARALPTGRAYWTTAYLVDGLLVDSGCAHSSLELAHTLASKSLWAIANTHSHEDHIGANGLLQHRNGGVNIFAHPLALPVLADPRRCQPLHPYRRLFWGWPEPSIGSSLLDGASLSEASGNTWSSKYEFKVIYTPGHSEDHLCIFEAERGWLFSGDLFVGGKDRALRAGCDIWQIIESLKRISGLQITWLFPGSARVRKNPIQEIRDKIDYLLEIGGQVLDLHNKGWSDRDVIARVCGGTMTVEWITLGHFSRRHLVRSYLDHDPAGLTTQLE